ncbi:BZ3500_MvSof-1268-A1-R1_Chr2-2g05109 [Microbotryum saponariae]|uniref:MMS19 nucleotide excision repair protein n=1 Tax=Microbotryum saponariae TaxID=289078 RepID=A0A2X0LWS0_9BASI|nr:BZ3500_MvSof-1268-A1-R1_Chr2-2g05109 [Microbotryum saponariae]SDA00935.1 BZ3501_MvSof-1269-A2-R1_Chr2-2g04783 [Microbotryum saponariae]
MATSIDQLAALVRSYSVEDDPSASTIPTRIADGLDRQQYKLIELVKSLRELLIAEHDQTRAKGQLMQPVRTQLAMEQPTRNETASGQQCSSDYLFAPGVSLLSRVVAEIDRSQLDRQSTNTLTTFFADKLSDKPLLLSCASALAALTESPTFGTGEGVQVARALFASIDLQTYPQASRFVVYQLVDALMSRSRPALKRLGREFIKGYSRMVEGEKDPRNLMLSFNLIRVILLEFDLTGSIEDLFDVTFCYFPITFNPPKDDPYGITSEDLIVALRSVASALSTPNGVIYHQRLPCFQRHCLSATPYFGKLALPLFLDKMQAASEKAKPHLHQRQTLQALITCFPIYGAAVCGEWAGRFSEALSIEVFHATDSSMMKLALECLRALYSTLYPDTSPVSITTTTLQSDEKDGDAEMPAADADEITKSAPAPTGVEGIAIKVVQNSLDELREPDKSNAKPAVKILNALICSSDRLAAYVLSVTVPQLLNLYKDPDEIALRAPTLACLADLLSSLSPLETPAPLISTAPADAPISFPPPTLPHAEGASPLEPFRDELLSVLTSGSRSASSRAPAMDGLVRLVRVPEFLAPPEVEYCISAIDDVLIGGADAESSSSFTEDDYENALDGLVLLAALHPRTVESSTLPKLFERLPTSAETVPFHKSLESTRYRKALEALAALCAMHPDLFEILSLRLLARLEGIISTPTPEVTPSVLLYAHHLLTTLKAVLKTKVEREDDDVVKYIEKFAPRLLGLFILPTVGPSSGLNGIVTDVRLLHDVAAIITVIVQRLDAGRQTRFAADVSAAFHSGQLEALLGESVKSAPTKVAFDPLGNGPTAQRNLILLYTASLVPIRPAVKLSPEQDINDLVRGTLRRSVQAEDEIQRIANLHLLGSLVNKRAPELVPCFEKDLSTFWTDNIEGGPASTRVIALRAWLWIAKGLIVRSEQRGYDMVSKIVGLFDDEVLGNAAAQALGVIADESDQVLSKDNFAVLRLLYKQRFCSFVLPKIVAGHDEASGNPSVLAVRLVALSGLLNHIPKQLTLTELPRLLPLLISALDLPDPLLRANVIDSLKTLTLEETLSETLELNIPSIVNKLIKSLANEIGSSKELITLRSSCLSFLQVLPAQVPYHVLHPQKPMVLKQLAQSVDDPKKQVRKLAVDCRSAWFTYAG